MNRTPANDHVTQEELQALQVCHKVACELFKWLLDKLRGFEHKEAAVADALTIVGMVAEHCIMQVGGAQDIALAESLLDDLKEGVIGSLRMKGWDDGNHTKPAA